MHRRRGVYLHCRLIVSSASSPAVTADATRVSRKTTDATTTSCARVNGIQIYFPTLRPPKRSALPQTLSPRPSTTALIIIGDIMSWRTRIYTATMMDRPVSTPYNIFRIRPMMTTPYNHKSCDRTTTLCHRWIIYILYIYKYTYIL